jgi:hypothetical protein
MVLAKVCRLCGQGFEFECTGPGRPREHCFQCVPPGFKAVRKPHRVKLRRVNPVGPPTPKGGWATVTQIGA